MKLTLEVYNELKQKVIFFYKKLNFIKYEKTKGRKLAISLVDTITLALYKQKSARKTKKSLWNDLKKYLKCSYKTLVVNLLMFTHLLSAFAPSALSWEHENTSSSQPRPLPKGDGSAQIASSALFQETVV